MSVIAPPSIAVIICSQRKPRVCPQIADFVVETLQSNRLSVGPDVGPPASLHLIDLATWNLPIFDEPTIPSQVHHHSGYKQPHTQAWSIEIQKYQGFIYVLPQYNWGYPAAIKNAIDYLFNEWKGKSGMIVSYGGHGGVKSAAQFRQVLFGVRMKVAETMPALTFPSKEDMYHASRGEPLCLSGEKEIWKPEREVICKAFDELLLLLSPGTEDVQSA